MKKNKKRRIITGTLSKHKKGFGFVIPDDPEVCSQDVFIASGSMLGAMNGDKVEVDLIPEYLWRSSPEGIIVKIMNRSVTEVVGTFEKSKRFGFVVPDNKKIKDDIFIRKKDFGKAQRGDKVVAQITKYPDANNSAEGKITELVSRQGQPGGDIKALIRSYDLTPAFPAKVNAEAKNVSAVLIPKEDIKDRRDLRDKTIVTIDGPDSKDFDDAVCVQKLENDNYLLGVHIADVSHYVTENGYLDKEALKRGNSVYLIDQVVPMLPKVLSNGICSLNPGQDRLTLSVEMEITPEGRVVAHDIFESVIHSKARLVYGDVSDFIEAENKDDCRLKKENPHVCDDILVMDELAKILRKKRFDAGSLDFDLDEAHISLDKKGIPVRIDIAERRVANKLIEEFMLLANETIAEHFFWMEPPFIYRVHEKPAPDKMEELQTFLRGFGINLRGSVANIHPGTLNNILEQVSGHSYESVVNTVILRSMQKAYYGTECKGHFGLSFKYYCHFTSPIRRYPDLMIHRIIKEVIRGTMNQKRIKNYRKKTEDAADTASMTERRAIDLEREVEKMKKAEYMSYHVGEKFEGVVSGVTNFGIYVELANTVEGMVRLEYMDDDFYDYDPSSYSVIGRRTNKRYSLGDRMDIKVHSVSIENREINFTIEK